jgi:hypothetical protein
MLSADFTHIQDFFRSLFSRADKANRINGASALCKASPADCDLFQQALRTAF